MSGVKFDPALEFARADVRGTSRIRHRQRWTKELLKALERFDVTALAEILGCDSPYRCLQHGKPAWVRVPPAISLGLFTCRLSLHPTASGRVDTVYGGGYFLRH